jgi:glycosyltransferase involved in cell wall biosynthesis
VTPLVLHVLEALEGGTARHVVDLVRTVAGTRHAVAIPPERRGGLTDRRAEGDLRAAGADVRLVPMHRTPWAPTNATALARVRRLVRTLRPDVVHGHSSVGGVLARLAVAGTGVACAYTPNGIAHVRLARIVERRLRPLTDRFVAVSPSEGELAVALGLIHADHLVVIPNGVALEPPPPVGLRDRLGVPPGAPLVGSIARLVPQKAPEDLVAAALAVAAAVPEAHVVLIGDGPQARAVDAAVAASGVAGRVHRIAELPGAAGALPELDVFFLASRFEGAPYAPLEAMRAGVPVVLTDVVGSRDAVEPGTSGLLVPVGRPDALADAVVGLLRDPDRRRTIGAAGAARLRARFDVRAMGRSLEALYTSLAGDATSD